MELMDKIIEKLKQDEHYYGDYGKQFLSNSDINILLNPSTVFIAASKLRLLLKEGDLNLFSIVIWSGSFWLRLILYKS